MTATCQVPGLQRRDSQRVQSRRGDRNSGLILWCDMDICKYVKNMEGAEKKGDCQFFCSQILLLPPASKISSTALDVKARAP